MAGDDGIDLRQGGQGGGSVLHPVLGLDRSDARMGQRHDDIGPLGPESGKPGAGCVKDVAHADATVQMFLIPDFDLRWRKADDPDANRMAVARSVAQPAPEKGKGRHQRLVAQRTFAKMCGDVCRYDRKLRAGQGCRQEADAIVELMIAKRGRIVAQGVKGRDHRMGPPTPWGAGDVFGQRIALQKITIVKEKAVRHLGSGLGDLVGDGAKAASGDRAVGMIVIGQQAGMQVRGGNQTQGQRVWHQGKHCCVWPIPFLGLVGCHALSGD